ncbi:MAG: TRAP transporter small permease [Granulosicoccus sp.]
MHRFSRFAAALQGAADAIAVVAAWLAGFCLASLTILVLTDTLLAFTSRHFPDVPSGTGVGWEYSAYLMGAAFVLGAGLTLRTGLQLRVEVLLAVGGGRMARTLELIASALGTVVTLFLAINMARFTLRTYGYGEVSQDSFTPLWIPQIVLTAGFFVLAFQMIARFISGLANGTLNKPELGVSTSIE